MNNRPLKIQNSAPDETTQLSPSVHGKGCAIGELRLTKEELESVNAIIQSAGFRFTPGLVLAAEEPPEQPHLPAAEEDDSPQPLKRRTPNVKEDIAELAARPKRAVRTRKSTTAPPAEPQVSKRRRTNTPTPTTKKTAETSEPDPTPPPVEVPSPTPSPPPPPQPRIITIQTNPSHYATTVAPILCSQRKKSHFVIHSQTLTWESACEKLMGILDNNPHSKWFAIPVDPQTQGLQDYYDKIKTPMDLQTVRQKLVGGMYCHPFRWQHDVRTIFFNAFLYHPHDTPVWRSAAELAVTFENLCKEMIEANSYSVFVRPPPAPPPVVAPVPPAAPTATARTVEAEGSVVADAVAHGVPAATASAAAAAQQQQRKIARNYPTKNKRIIPFGVKIKEPGNVVTYTADCSGTDLAKFYEEHLPRSALPQPRLTQGTGMDGSGQSRSGGVSNSQKKNLPARFRELDVFYRKVLLDWVKDELGIHSLLCALEVRYVPDLDLLPPVKAKQFFVHMKSLMTQQKQAQDEQFLPTTLPRVLSWDTPTTSNVSGVAGDLAQHGTQPMASPAGVAGTPPPPPSMAITQQMITAASQLSTPHRSSWAVPNRKAPESSEDDSSEESSSSEEESSSDEFEAAANQPPTSAGTSTIWHKHGGMAWGGLGKQRMVPPLPLGGGLGLWRQSGYNVGSGASAQASLPVTPAAAPPENQSSCWGEWKARAMQHDFQLRAKAQDVTAATESEARAEGADAEI